MRKINPSELLDQLVHLTLRLNKEVTAEFSGLNHHQLGWSPDRFSWSIRQCFAHLNAFHRLYVPIFAERIKNSRFQEPTDVFQSSPLGNSTYMKVKLGKLNNIKRKLKSPKDYNPLVNRSLKTENVLEDFVKYQLRLVDILEKARTVNIRKTKSIFSTVPIIKLRIGDAFQYVVYHCERHVEQAKNIKRNSRFPS